MHHGGFGGSSGGNVHGGGGRNTEGDGNMGHGSRRAGDFRGYTANDMARIAEFPESHAGYFFSGDSDSITSDDSDSDSMDSEFPDPLDAMLEYILEACPKAQYSCAEDDDLIPYKEHLSNWSTFPAVLRQIKPMVYLRSNGLASLVNPDRDLQDASMEEVVAARPESVNDDKHELRHSQRSVGESDASGLGSPSAPTPQFVVMKDPKRERGRSSSSSPLPVDNSHKDHWTPHIGQGDTTSTAPSKHRRSLSDLLAIVRLRPHNDSTRGDMSEAERSRLQDVLLEDEKTSKEIDAQLQQEEATLRRKKQVKILLLGQSESGKSTTLKQFQLLHAPAAFQAERIAWRPVIYLNLIRSVLHILDVLLHEPTFASPSDLSSVTEPSQEDLTSDNESVSESPQSIDTPSTVSEETLIRFKQYADTLAPLRVLQEELIYLLSTPGEDEPTHLAKPQSSFAFRSAATANLNASKLTPDGTSQEIQRTGDILDQSLKGPGDIMHVLRVYSQVSFGMIELWQDDNVREALTRAHVRMEEFGGFYLNDIERITHPEYIPTANDVLKARLKTTRVTEHTLPLASDSGAPVEWKIYDVGGVRHQRKTWAPYFDDVNAIIFLAPVSAFNQTLEEDQRTNRLEDSVNLWKSLVSNGLVANINIILFLNKCDLLRAKLEGGVKINQYVKSYANRSNDYDTALTYFSSRFRDLYRSLSPNNGGRSLHTHYTSVTDIYQTAGVLNNVRGNIIRENLTHSRLV